MYPFNDSTGIPTSDSMMSNTTQVDVFGSSDNDYPEFWKEVVPDAMSATLEPGDLLFFPPGWWHAFRSEDISFSVSMWF
jgi:ribosomal protein L16 Arg81 hydroxylase